MDLLNAVEGPYQSRDYCIITLFLNCGMRLSELVNINLNDINHKEHVMRITGKGKQRAFGLFKRRLHGCN